MATPKRTNKLFHTVVIVGAAMTGGAAAAACGGGSSNTCEGPACSYAQISYNPDAYATIADARGEYYGHIQPNDFDAGQSDTSVDDAGDAADAPADASDSG